MYDLKVQPTDSAKSVEKIHFCIACGQESTYLVCVHQIRSDGKTNIQPGKSSNSIPYAPRRKLTKQPVKWQ